MSLDKATFDALLKGSGPMTFDRFKAMPASERLRISKPEFLEIIRSTTVEEHNEIRRMLERDGREAA